jgi:hypothetical protein
MTLVGARKRRYQRKWEADHSETRRGRRHLSPAREGHFVSFDGEAYRRTDGTSVYSLLQDSTGGIIEDLADGLSSESCFRFLADAPKRFGRRICGVSFGFDYDVNNFLRDLPTDKLQRLHDSNEVKCGHWRLEWRPRKWFQVSQLDPDSNLTIPGRSVRIFDTFSFYGQPFVVACEAWLGKEDPDLKIVREGKDRRSNFAREDAAYMREYNSAELRLMVRLTQALKAAFDGSGLRLTQFYGPGAAGGALLQQIGFKHAINPLIPLEIETAARHGYFGGRIEVPIYGRIPGPVYDYDINSAYPAWATRLPNLTAGHWVEASQFDPHLPFSLYHARWTFPTGRAFYPFPWRAPKDELPGSPLPGSIYFPSRGQAWVWAPELQAALECGGFPKRAIRVLSGWKFIPDDPTDHPLVVLREWYEKRLRLKEDKNPAERAIKITLNAICGKLAQSVSGMAQFGGREGKGRRPTFHQIEYAGFITSACRAMVYRAASQDPGAILAFATDGILTRKPLRLPISDKLGEWKTETYDSATIVQSGVYRLLSKDGRWKNFGRGYADGDLPWDEVEAAWRGVRGTLSIESREQFIGLGAVALTGRWSLWRTWMKIPRSLNLKATGKRWDLHLQSQWTSDDNPGTRPHSTEPTLPISLMNAHIESAPWVPKFEDSGALSYEDGETVESAVALLSALHDT